MKQDKENQKQAARLKSRRRSRKLPNRLRRLRSRK